MFTKRYVIKNMLRKLLKLRIAQLLPILMLPFILPACGDDDESNSTDYNLEDPRIRAVKFNNIASAEFVVNDVEATIFNYDSLTYGTDVSKVRAYFYGYTSQPTIQYRKEGDRKWTAFTNGELMDFSSPLLILATSQDGQNKKQYTFDLRIHSYDIAAFSWTAFSSMNIEGNIVSQKAITTENDFRWFYRNDNGDNFCLTSTDGKSWQATDIDADFALQWETLVALGDTLWVQSESGVCYASPLATLNFAERNVGEVKRLLFELDGKLWAITTDSLLALGTGDSQFAAIAALPDDFPTENITPFTAKSGFTQVGYTYALTEDGGGTVWTIDYKGNSYQLVKPQDVIPGLTEPMVYIYGKTLGIVGGTLTDGTPSAVCYASYNSGVNWAEDWHKNLSDDMKGLTKTGFFALSDSGELLIVGGNKADGTASTTVWKGVLNQITADELNYND